MYISGERLEEYHKIIAWFTTPVTTLVSLIIPLMFYRAGFTSDWGVLYAMGIDAPNFDEKGWTSQIPDGVFTDYNGEYRDISHLTGAAPRVSKVHHQSEPV